MGLERLFGLRKIEYVEVCGEIIKIDLTGVTDAQAAIEAAKAETLLRQHESEVKQLGIANDKQVKESLGKEANRVGKLLNQATRPSNEISLWKDRIETGVEAVQEESFRHMVKQIHRRNSNK